MLHLSVLLRGAVCASRRCLSADAAAAATQNTGSALVSSGGARVAVWDDAAHRAAALESLSDEVFGRGNRHLKNVETLTALPEGLHSFPEVCFIGKPNCGKSSLISCLLHNRRLGRAGATAGTTRLLQFFNVGDGLLLVDTPGYGAWGGRHVGQLPVEQANACSILFRYLALRNGSNLKRVYWLMEASARTPVRFQPRDEELLAFLSREQIPFSVVLTKIDRHWRHCAELRRTTDQVGRDGLVRLAPAQLEAQRPGSPLPVEAPEVGVARNVEEVCAFLGTDKVPILGVSANRLKPDRSRNLELLQHDIVHYCAQDLLPTEALSLRNLHRLSYAPPSADRIHEVQLRYPVESFVIPRNDNVSLTQMVAQHEAAKARFRENGVSTLRLSAKDVPACHLDSVAERMAQLDWQADQQRPPATAPPTPRRLSDSTAPAAAAALESSPPVLGGAEACGGQDAPQRCSSDGAVHAEARISSDSSGAAAVAVEEHTASPVRRRPLLTGAPQERRASLEDVLESVWEEAEAEESVREGDRTASGSGARKETSDPVLSPRHASSNGAPSLDCPPRCVPCEVSAAPLPWRRSDLDRLQDSSTSATALPAMVDPHVHYVTAIDGTAIPRSMVSVSVEQLALSKEDELAHFATKSGAGAYEELLLVDREGGGAERDLFLETEGVARLPEEAQARLMETRQIRTRSAARKQEERFMAKYVERRRKERSIYMQAQGYMCPWLGRSDGRSSVQGAADSHTTGTGRMVMRDLKAKGFGGKSYSARTMKNRGRATKKTGFWAA
ncbi:50S ribosome-binding GTPase [Novymonas esmeraldas]|uniref:50S ribosome-binding GTPase n=1 Tax=Novymonas esmeraldas TaxID=1808958 RepID=A0AAW0EVU6_9TRYP